MFRTFIRKWLGIPNEPTILLIREKGEFVYVFMPIRANVDWARFAESLRTKGSLIAYDDNFPVEIRDL